MSNKKFIKKMEDELIPDNKEIIKQRLGISDLEVKEKHHYSFTKPLVSFALVIALCFGLFTFFKFNNVTKMFGKTYVSIDVNPSIEFVVDENMNVTTCTPKNSKAKVLLVNNDYLGKNINEVTKSLIRNLNLTGYISMANKKNAILVTAINEDHGTQKAIQDTINKEINSYFIENHIFGVVINGDNVIDNNLQQEANKNSISVGKMKIINSIINSFDVNDPNRPTVEQLKDKKISELDDILEDIDDLREDVIDELEDELEDLLDLLEDYSDEFGEEEEEDIEDSSELTKEKVEQEIIEIYNAIVKKWGNEILKDIVIDFTNILETINKLDILIEELDDLDDKMLSSLDDNNLQFKIKQFNSLQTREEKIINSLNKQDYIDDFEDNYEDWLEENKLKYEEKWDIEKQMWEKDFD